MKKNKLVAAILFGVLAVVQFFGLTYVFSSALTQMPTLIYIEMVALAVYVITCLRLIKTADVAITCGEKRSAAALCVMYFLAIAINVDMIAQLLGLAFGLISQELATNPTTGIAFLIFRTALLFAALFFTIINEKERIASIEFEPAALPSELISEEAVDEITEKLDDAEV